MPDNYVMQDSENQDAGADPLGSGLYDGPPGAQPMSTPSPDDATNEVQATLASDAAPQGTPGVVGSVPGGGAAAGVLTPSDQSTATTPDALSGLIQSQAAQPQFQGPGMWKRLVLGALGGLATGGVAGAARWTPLAGDKAAYTKMVLAKAQARANQQAQAQQALQDGAARLGHMQLETQLLRKQYDSLPDGIQQAMQQEGIRQAQTLENEGIQPIASGLTEDGAHNILAHAYDNQPNQASHYVTYPTTKGTYSVYKVPDPNATNKSPMTVVTGYIPGGPDGKDYEDPTPLTVQLPPGSVKVADALASPVVAMSKYTATWNKQNSTIQSKVDVANQTGVTNKNNALAAAATQNAATNANKASNNAPQQDENGNPVWNPKVTADEKKKTELAENIAENANGVASILQRRPDLVGAVAGRYTSTQQMIGNNDPDISALGTRVHNIAMANSGVHGFRSQEGVANTEKLILNSFKNGPKAVGGSLSALTGSTQTFIDNARPATYKTHSKNGGAIRAMQGGQ